MPLRITNSTTDVATLNRWAEDIETRLNAASKQAHSAVATLLGQTGLPVSVGTVKSVAFAGPKEATITGSPITTSGTITWAWATEPPGTIFQSPPPGLSGLEGGVTSPNFNNSGGTKTYSLQFTPLTASSLALVWSDPAGPTFSPAGYTLIGDQLYYKAITTGAQINLTSPNVLNGQFFVASLTVLQGPAPTLIQNAQGAQSASFGVNNTAGNMIVVAVSGQSTKPLTIVISDTAGNTYSQVVSMGVANNLGTAYVVDNVYIATGILGSANTISTTITTAGSLFNPQIVIAEFGPPPAGPGIPFFAPFNTALLPPINLGSNGNGGVAGILKVASGGTGANLSATGGPGQLVKQASVGGNFTVGSLLGPTVKTAAYTAALGDLVLVNTAAGGVTITLPVSTGNTGGLIAVKKISLLDANFVTVQTTGTDLIDGGSTAPFSIPLTSLTFVADGAGNWEII